MRDNSIHAVEELSLRAQTVRDKALRLRVIRDNLKEDLEVKQSEVGSLTDSIEKLSKVSELFRVLMDLLVVKQVKSVEDIITEGFKSIFHDLDISFESDVGPKYNKISVDFFIRQGSKDDPLSPRGHPLDSFGGGPCSIASLILRVLTTMRLGRYPMFILDEALGAVSEDYVEQTSLFLKGLSEKMGTDILLVTHKPSFCEKASNSYKCSEVVEHNGSRHIALCEVDT